MPVTAAGHAVTYGVPSVAGRLPPVPYAQEWVITPAKPVPTALPAPPLPHAAAPRPGELVQAA
ncbi:hypothetical protein ADK70_07925 [Streptomyces rimosus subsp. pseudoverticillatus]|uniref:hypothetical protein n=1 Tax=Streptomyces rimosus TaxID=1927 RepID=UPI0006B2A31C|nr:hypothetical protein [Streptomyces rimosus]KOT97627.1 hypothetical protein ADK70_07925 [Streptomyces rimosus subsp. pseudoverticillatus]